MSGGLVVLKGKKRMEQDKMQTWEAVPKLGLCLLTSLTFLSNVFSLQIIQFRIFIHSH
jgi:hypothetical protein